MSISLLGLSYLDQFLTIFDIIPKIIYLMYSCLASAADAMQLLVRRLCGLDLYYIDGEEVLLTDPLTEFINGILGIGNSAGTMQALNTTFWSLAIFGLILLALTSIVALIKAHYKEDVASTSPGKILYGAFKSILTFAIVPIVVVIGFQLSGLLLRTLDNITGGTVSEETVNGIYGSDHGFKEVGERDGTKIYSSYDLFGVLAQPATNSPISGQLFRAAAYQSNRFRLGTYTTDNVKDGNKDVSLGLLGKGPSYDSAEDKNEYLAYQVDYAFMNSLQIKDDKQIENSTIMDNANNAGNRIGKSNNFAVGNKVESFTKYNVFLIWVYYDLWQFNFIIAFAGALSVFMIMVSIIIGLMMRLIKSAAMFLIYPPLLGLAPMDNFKAFQSWANEFIKQILSAFGAIVGINLLFLILPYVQAISFFNQWFLDGIVNVVFLATGLIMVKDFISMVAGFVGGGDVFSTGEGAKGQVAGTLKKGIVGAATGGAGFLNATRAIPAFIAKGAYRKIQSKRLRRKMEENQNRRDIADKQAELDANKTNRQSYENRLRSQAENDFANDSANRAYLQSVIHSNTAVGDAVSAEYNKAWDEAVKSGKYSSFQELDAAASAAAEKKLAELDSGYGKRKNAFIQGKVDNDAGIRAFDAAKQDAEEELKELQADQKEKELKLQEKAERNYLNKDGTASAKGAFAMMWNIGAQTLGSAKMFLKNVAGELNIDKLAGTAKSLVFRATGRDDQGNQAIKSQAYTSAETNRTGRAEQMAIEKGFTRGSTQFEQAVKNAMRDSRKAAISQAFEAMGSVLRQYAGLGANIGPGQIKYGGEKLQQQQLKATQKQTETVKEQNERIDELIETIEKFINKSGTP